MSDEEPTQIPADAPAPAPEARVDAPAPEPDPAPEPHGEPAVDLGAATETVDQHPEFLVAGAFAGAFLFAKILRRIGGS